MPGKACMPQYFSSLSAEFSPKKMGMPAFFEGSIGRPSSASLEGASLARNLRVGAMYQNGRVWRGLPKWWKNSCSTWYVFFISKCSSNKDSRVFELSWTHGYWYRYADIDRLDWITCWVQKTPFLTTELGMDCLYSKPFPCEGPTWSIPVARWLTFAWALWSVHATLRSHVQAKGHWRWKGRLCVHKRPLVRTFLVRFYATWGAQATYGR